jgi:hypothetical protein
LLLGNLGSLYFQTDRRMDAAKALTEAVAICREIAQQEPGNCRVMVVTLLTGLGSFYSSTGRPDDANNAYMEALKLCHDFAPDNPDFYSKMADGLAELQKQPSLSAH